MATSKKVQFVGSKDRRLVAILDQPDESPRAFAIYAHCFTCTKNIKAAYWIGKTLAGHGIAMLRFDFSGVGESDGELSDANFSANIEDIKAAAAFLREHHRAPGLMLGHSLGGSAVLAAVAQIPEVRAVATVGAPYYPDHLRRYLKPSSSPGLFEIEISGRRFQLEHRFVEDLERQRLAEHIGALDRALLVFHSPVDRVVGVDQAALIFKAAKHPKSFISLDNADHLLSGRKDAQFVGHMLAAWCERYLD